MREHQTPPPRWDLTATMLVVLAVAGLLLLTFDLWVPYFGGRR